MELVAVLCCICLSILLLGECIIPSPHAVLHCSGYRPDDFLFLTGHLGSGRFFKQVKLNQNNWGECGGMEFAKAKV